MNFKTAYSLLTIFGRQQCPLCLNHVETVEHLFKKCNSIKIVLDQAQEWMDLARGNHNKITFDEIKYLDKISDKVTYIIISQYKLTIWIARNNAKFKNEAFDPTKTKKIMEHLTNFHIKLIEL